MKINAATALGWIACGAAVVTAMLGPAAILIPLVGTLSLAYFALTTPSPRSSEKPQSEISPAIK